MFAFVFAFAACTGLPPAWPYSFSGWDIQNIALQYDAVNDALHIGIDCYAVCGDADGDGDPDRSSMQVFHTRNEEIFFF